jgi:hypothetical protein
MSTRDSDIDFDFFDDEPETEEAPQRRRIPRVGQPGGGPRRPVRPPGDFIPLLRLAGLIAFAILIIVLLVFWIRSCQGASKRHRYQSYMSKVSTLAHDSQQNGRALNDLLTTPGEKLTDLENKLDGYAQQEAQGVSQADAIAPPGPLRSEHQHLVEALQLRVSGLRGLADAFRRTATSKDSAVAGAQLAAQAQRLVASDVVWDDLFKDPTRLELKRQGITGVNVPGSNFVQNPDLASTHSMVPVFQRLHGASTGGNPGGLHGTGLVGVKAMPQNITLSTSTQSKIIATTDLAFEVTVQDTGDSQEVHIPVKLTISKRQGSAIVKTQTIDLINAGEQKTLTFTNIGQPDFAEQSTVKVEVAAVPGEHTVSNNSATYPVIFSLG